MQSIEGKTLSPEADSQQTKEKPKRRRVTTSKALESAPTIFEGEPFLAFGIQKQKNGRLHVVICKRPGRDRFDSLWEDMISEEEMEFAEEALLKALANVGGHRI